MNTFGRNLQLTALGDLDRLEGLVARSGLEVLNLVDDVVALEDLAENDVAAVQPTKEARVSIYGRGDACHCRLTR